MHKCCLQFNNIATIIFRQNVRYFATERNTNTNSRTVGTWIFLQLGETTIGTWHFLQLFETTIGSISRNNRTSFQILSASNVTRTVLFLIRHPTYFDLFYLYFVTLKLWVLLRGDQFEAVQKFGASSPQGIKLETRVINADYCIIKGFSQLILRTDYAN